MGGWRVAEPCSPIFCPLFVIVFPFFHPLRLANLNGVPKNCRGIDRFSQSFYLFFSSLMVVSEWIGGFFSWGNGIPWSQHGRSLCVRITGQDQIPLIPNMSLSPMTIINRLVHHQDLSYFWEGAPGALFEIFSEFPCNFGRSTIWSQCVSARSLPRHSVCKQKVRTSSETKGWNTILMGNIYIFVVSYNVVLV